MKDRIKAVREYYHLTMEAFGSRIGIKKSSVSLLESGKNEPSERTIKAICREFGISEPWLRDGVGDDMFDQAQTSLLSRLASEYNLSDREQAVVASFLELDESDRAAIMRYVDKLVEKCSPASVSDTAAEAVAAARDYMNMVADEKNNMDESSTSAG